MISYVTSFFNYLFSKISEEDEDDSEKEKYLAEQLLELEIAKEQEHSYIDKGLQEIPRETSCFQRTGVITYINDDILLIDGMLCFDHTNCPLKLNENDKILYLGYKDENESIVVVRILENLGMFWGDAADEDNFEQTSFEVIDHIIVGEVDYRQDRYVFIKDHDLKFSLDEVESSLVPVKGDWLEMKCNIQWDDNKQCDVSAAQVIKILSIKPLRSKTKSAVVTEYFEDYGICDRQIYFSKECVQNNVELKIGDKVFVDMIESNQGTCSWRAIRLLFMESLNLVSGKMESDNFGDTTLEMEKEHKLDITYPIIFDKIDFNENAKITVSITNRGNQLHFLNKWIILSKKRDSQVTVLPVLMRPYKLSPGESFSLYITCRPKFIGNTKENIIIMFRGFQVRRCIEINVVNRDLISFPSSIVNKYKTPQKNDNMINIRSRSDKVIGGVKTIKPPAFVPVKLGMFHVPERFWSAVLGNSTQTIHSSDYSKILSRIESTIPCLAQNLNVNNYIDRWHALLYMEEIQSNINMRVYDMPKAFLIRCQEYLGIEVSGLSEKRPSLIVGDKVLVKDLWTNSSQMYEGYIHVIRGELVLIKFHQQFHEIYSGTDVSVEFYATRTVFRRSHQAINLTLSNLGPDILFPSHILSRPSQIPPDKLQNIEWFNKDLNVKQKTAVTNILKGESRPLPYCIFGPPGTGKTMTVIETILQIITLLPDSRILVATPSNSASNLITERLVQYKNALSISMIRIIANYLADSDTIPDVIKPFCATLDYAKEGTTESRQEIRNGINLNCRKSFIGRSRVTIGTCYCIGALAVMGLPRGHFTHVIVDEAGQATEPEIMIPMTLIDKESGQIIIAGDPMQLGPLVLSKYCIEYGMDESYLSRILETFPYQKDFAAYEDGFNDKLITRLNDNYRSLKTILMLPSKLFYDACLVENIDENQSWIQNLLKVIGEIYEFPSSKSGGIFVHGVRGCNMRAEDSPSWFNPQEASMVALTACKLYKKNIDFKEIGIITPYIAQIKYIRLLFDSMGLPQPKIGTVEEFQGQERPLIIISTVRSSESYLQEDVKNTLGFVKSPKRLNVALTRAQVAVILFCDPHLLNTDPLWQRVIQNAVIEEKYVGCDLPDSLVQCHSKPYSED